VSTETVAKPTDNLLRGEAEAKINGVAFVLRIVAEPGDRELVGVVGLRHLWHFPLVAFRLSEGGLDFVDIDDDEADEAVAELFGIGPHEVRGALCKLAVEALLGPEIRALTPEEAARLLPRRAGAVH
jgi:hypothetical protein